MEPESHAVGSHFSGFTLDSRGLRFADPGNEALARTSRRHCRCP
jgi:hypothetical protein